MARRSRFLKALLGLLFNQYLQILRLNKIKRRLGLPENCFKRLLHKRNFRTAYA
jgi:AraC-like DNA-binding protein